MTLAHLSRRSLFYGAMGAVGASSFGTSGFGASGFGAGGLARAMPASAQPARQELSGEAITLTIGRGAIVIDGQAAHAITVNGQAPAPLLRLRQGQNLRLTVINTLAEETSLHWHGLLLPFQMDGVPGVSFPGTPSI